jgi:hypothetical protein
MLGVTLLLHKLSVPASMEVWPILQNALGKVASYSEQKLLAAQEAVAGDHGAHQGQGVAGGADDLGQLEPLNGFDYENALAGRTTDQR